ncbi:MAG: RIP metalloprotease RseP [Pseudomonadota bacterium]
MDITTLISSSGGVAYTIVAFVVALSIIVAIHEYGHYIVGRWSGIHADVFSLGFGPVLYSRTDKRGTVWQLAALPFGGYVKFKGDANAASAGADPNIKPARDTMHGAPLWARSATVAAGPIFNFILSFFIFAGVLLFAGQASDPTRIERFLPLPAGHEQGLQVGDVLLEIEGQSLNGEREGGIADLLPTEASLEYLVDRDGQEILVSGPYPTLPIVSSLTPRSAAIAAGLEVGDLIQEINGTPISTFPELQSAAVNSNGEPLALKVWREGEPDLLDYELTPRPRDFQLADGSFERRWMIGVQAGGFFEPARENLGIGTALVAGVERTWGVITGSINGLGAILSGEISTCNLNGPVGIAQTSSAMAQQGTESFIWFIAVLSTAVGLLNLFPIPILDGGHLVFHAYEAVSGKPPSDRVLNALMATGLTILLGFMVFALGNDLFCP